MVDDNTHQTQNDAKEMFKEKKRHDERDRAMTQGTRGVTDNALRGMAAGGAGTVNVDSTGEVVDINDLQPPDSIDLGVIKQRFEAKAETIGRLFAVDADYDADVNISDDSERLVFTVSIVDTDDTDEVMSLNVVVHADNTAVVVTKTEGEYDVAPVFEAVGNMPVMDRVFYDFKKEARDGLLREALDKRNEEIRGLYAPKPKPVKKAKKKAKGETEHKN